jgi:2-dehydro-3-deoxyphosphogluconate aldolase/(4S)-4-hydroxy-2-oxoglutarate aldolase
VASLLPAAAVIEFLPMSVAESPASTHSSVAAAVAHTPLVGVIRTHDGREAERQAKLFVAGGIRLVEVTFTVPDAPQLVSKLLAERGDGAWKVGMGTVTDAARAQAALAAGSEFVVSPNVSLEVAEIAKQGGRFLLIGALTPTEIVAARQAGADLVKVFPLPPVGGPAYLRAVRGPLGDIPMLASGGFGPEEIPAYREAGAVAFGIGAPLLAGNDDETLRRIGGAVALARQGSGDEA